MAVVRAQLSTAGRTGAYLDPGVYINQGRAVGDAVASGNPFALCIVGVGSRVKRTTNEEVQRAAVIDESLSGFVLNTGVAPATVTGYEVALANRAIRRKDSVLLQADGVTTLADNEFSFNRAYIDSENGPFNLTSGTAENVFILQMDGKAKLVIEILEDATATGVTGTISGTSFNPATVNDRYILVEGAFASSGAATAAELADAINIALSSATATATGLPANVAYGSLYQIAASVSGTAVRLMSPSTINSQIQDVVTEVAPFNSGTNAIWGVDNSAQTVITISESFYESDRAYTISYVTTEVDDYDELSVPNATRIVSVGSRPSLQEFTTPNDYLPNLLSGNNGIVWNPGAPASFTGTNPSTFNLSASDLIILDIDGNGPVVVDLVGNGANVVHPDYADPVDTSAATAAEVANNINTSLSTHRLYGPDYANVASVTTEAGSDFITITSPTLGRSSSVSIRSPVSATATEAIFGSANPPQTIGSGGRPQAGAVYYVTYDTDRLEEEYDFPILHIGRDAFFSAVGTPSQTNPLAIAGEIAFDNGIQRLYTIQINDASALRAPNRTEVNRALDSLNTNESITDIVLLQNDQVSRVDFAQKLTELNSLSISRLSRGYIGLPRNSDVGDTSTPDSMVFVAANEFSAPSVNLDLAGRQFLIAPSNVSRTILLPDLTQRKVALDGGYVAVAVAALRTLISPGESMASRTITGFDLDDFEEYNAGERAQLASNGVTVVTLDAGRLVLLDPKPTEQFGRIRFELDNFSTQNDNLAFKLADAYRANFVGVTPTDPGDFIFDIKINTQEVINTEIALGNMSPYFDPDTNQIRPIDLTSDVIVSRGEDPREWNVGVAGTLRVVALRFFVTMTFTTQ